MWYPLWTDSFHYSLSPPAPLLTVFPPPSISLSSSFSHTNKQTKSNSLKLQHKREEVTRQFCQREEEK